MKNFKIIGWYCGKERVLEVKTETLREAEAVFKEKFPGSIIIDWK